MPRVHGPALQMLDWTLVDADGEPRRVYREVEGDPATADSLIHGFRPAMLARDNVSGKRKLAPFNLVSSWYWLAGDPRFYELNDVLQYLGQFAFRSPTSAYKHSAAQFLKLRGWIESDEPHPKALRRPESDIEILRKILEQLEALT